MFLITPQTRLLFWPWNRATFAVGLLVWLGSARNAIGPGRVLGVESRLVGMPKSM